jgi:S1-C subfamily serine protease
MKLLMKSILLVAVIVSTLLAFIVAKDMEEQRKRTLEQITGHIQESVDQVLEINRLESELKQAVDWCESLMAEQEDAVLTLPELVEEVIDGVVCISTSSDEGGSGFVIGPRLIKTARHMTRGATEFIIITNDGHVLRATRSISHKNHDTSFIYIDDLTCIAEASEDLPCRKGGHEVELHVLELGSTEDCKLGQEIFSIGSPAGMANFNAVAKGTIQTLDNRLAEYVPQVQGMGWSALFGITAEGGGGNSGGPVFTMDGKVVGIWVASNQPNLHYAVPGDVFVDDIDAVMLMFVQDKYQVEKISDHRTMVMQNQIELLLEAIVNLQQQISYLQQDNEDLLDTYEWFLENKEALVELCEIYEVENG